MGQVMWVRMLPGYSTEDANGGVGTAVTHYFRHPYDR
jgi:hypothetical protein